MKEVIEKRLALLEREQDVRILYAAESGSRAWGFASPDSDYDVRFIYLRPLRYYLRLEPLRDVIELPLEGELDINGWDLQKTLRLLHTSNPTLFEWGNSPLVYRTSPYFERLRGQINDYFKAKAGLYHYLSTAHSNYREYLKTEHVKAKKYLYVLRPLLACKWILRENCPPPMLFSELAEQVLETRMRPAINRLLEIKQQTPEKGMISQIKEINDYIEENLECLKQTIDALPAQNQKDWEGLDRLFWQALELEE